MKQLRYMKSECQYALDGAWEFDGFHELDLSSAHDMREDALTRHDVSNTHSALFLSSFRIWDLVRTSQSTPAETKRHPCICMNE